MAARVRKRRPIRAQRGDTVRVHYTGTLADGTLFDTTTERGPSEFKIGEGRIIPGFEEALLGMAEGELRTVRVPAEKAYGPRRENLVMVVSRTKLPMSAKPRVGQQVRLGPEDGRSLAAEVTGVSDSTVTLDANHPLAGRELVFEIRLIEIEPG